MRLLGVLVVLALVAAVVAVFMRSNRRERTGESASFWPQSNTGQLAAVVLAAFLAVFVIGAVMAAV